MKTNVKRQSVNRIPVAGVLRLHRVERRSTLVRDDGPQAVPTPRSLKSEYTSRAPAGSSGRTQNQITKRTQSGPLFSTKVQDESQIPVGGDGTTVPMAP